MIAPKDQEIQALFEHNAFKAPTLFCGSGHRIKQFCFSPECNYDSFCCDEGSCALCERQHRDCSFKKLWQLDSLVQERLFLHSRVLRKLFDIQNELMNKLTANRRQIIKKSKEWTIRINSETIELVYSKNIIKGIKGKQMKELFLEISQKSDIEKNIDDQLASYKREGEQMVSKMEKMRTELLLNLAKNQGKPQKKEQLKEKPEIPSKEQKPQILSKILAEDKEGSQKYSFLLKQLNSSSLKLLFRASQHNFSAAKFHQCCDGISDTVTIVRTEFDKTIAAYTPLKWSSANVNGAHFADDSRLSFLLQLELREKMTLTEPQKAISNYPNWGPIFGGGSDLCIADKCNQNQSSRSNFPHSYNCNGKYQPNSQQSYTAFCGSPKGCNFRVFEYEVFVVVSK